MCVPRRRMPTPPSPDTGRLRFRRWGPGVVGKKTAPVRAAETWSRGVRPCSRFQAVLAVLHMETWTTGSFVMESQYGERATRCIKQAPQSCSPFAGENAKLDPPPRDSKSPTRRRGDSAPVRMSRTAMRRYTTMNGIGINGQRTSRNCRSE